jgi:cysteinyl-tRNA synthetase
MEKDWATADALRKQIGEEGFSVTDTGPASSIVR